ncbi:MAG: glycosyltransferase [Flavobacteriales bacterium]|nr:glycosyltransferase [Flavobacteriales bacterium]
MKLTIVIVNYNVKFFLEQCLLSVQQATKGMDAEVFVVDNNSVDGSVAMVRERFPQVKVIANTENVGFSKANNQAVRESSGEYVLLLNPDTVLEEDTLSQTVAFMDTHPDAGGLGVKMVDGNGRFLRESKRSLPTPSVAFFKIFGLSSLFPRSKVFSRYHLGHLDNNQVHSVEVLAGAFMLLRKEALDKTGLLDETFFMYGEDIDLSYRLTKAGYKNYYYPHTRIIHYKGESTKKSSVNYVLVFYKAMVIFARKHFSHKNARLFSLLIHAAIYLRAGVAILHRFVVSLARPLLDGALILGGLWGLAALYEHYVKFPGGGQYPDFFANIMLPAYALTWVLSMAIGGVYRSQYKLSRLIRPVLTGTVLILAVYALLDKSYQVSRAMILIGAVWTFAVTFLSRLIGQQLTPGSHSAGSAKARNILIVGAQKEAARVEALLRQNTGNINILGWVSPDAGRPEDAIGHMGQLKELVIVYRADEVIFCSEDIPAHNIIDTMAQFGHLDINFRIAPPEALFIIGSQSIEAPRDLYVIDVNSIGKSFNRRNKRLADIISSLVLLALTPVGLLVVKGKSGYLRNIFQVLTGKKTWVGYHPLEQGMEHLPKLKPGVLSPSDGLHNQPRVPETLMELNMLYAKDYSIEHDLNIMVKGFSELGRV